MNRDTKRLAVAFTGPSNSGKTTLIENISKILQEKGFKIAIIKNDPKDKARFDQEGKDSYRFSQIGAEVAVVSPHKTTLFKKQTSSIEEIVSMFSHFDFLFVEGLKNIPLPRICIQRGVIDINYFEVSDCLAIDETINTNNLPKNMSILDLNNIDEIIQWIQNNAKEV
ncbi:MAG: molybdopterin-guanine dinucleotide biosynthesis protein B [Arcobacteraceae bacterium]